MLTLKKLNSNSPTLNQIKRFFFEAITPLYGDQTKALAKIVESKDRNCIVLMEGASPLGLVIFKKQLTDEFKKIGLKNHFEIKTLALLDPATTSRRGYGKLLLLAATKEAVRMHAEGIFVTVSSGKPEAYNFFLKMGFRPLATIKNLYKQGLNEVYFAHNDPSQLLINLSTRRSYTLELLKRLREKKNFNPTLAHAAS